MLTLYTSEQLSTEPELNAKAEKCGSWLQLDAVTVRESPLSVILLFVVFVGLCDGVAQGAIFGDVALLPPKYTQVTHMPRALLQPACIVVAVACPNQGSCHQCTACYIRLAALLHKHTTCADLCIQPVLTCARLLYSQQLVPCLQVRRLQCRRW